MISIINEFVWDSALYHIYISISPYQDKEGIMQWADSVFHVGKQQIFSEHKTLTLLKHKKKMKEIEKNFADTHLNK